MELAGEGSNLQHSAPKADVLPIELPAKGGVSRVVRGGALNRDALATSALQVNHSDPLGEHLRITA